MKKTPGDIIILHNCTKNHDHMLHYSWDMARDVCNWYFLFWAIFALLTPYQQEKWNFQKKWKKTPGDIIISQKRPKNHDHMLYCSWDMARDTWNYYFFILGYFLPFNPPPPLPNSPKNENFKKMKTKPGDIIILHVYQKLWLDHDWFLRYGAWRTDGQKKWHIEVGVPHLKNTKQVHKIQNDKIIHFQAILNILMKENLCWSS